jgi:hypothetical protein
MLGSGRKGRATRKTNRPKVMKGGMGYGMNGTIGTAGALYTPSWGGEVTKSGEPIFEPGARPPVTGGRRRRKSTKATKKAKKSRRRKTMRGGAQWQSVGAVGYGFDGSGSRGLANAAQYASKVPPAAGAPEQNPDGGYRA